ncbi:MAG: efflux RND transporter periplasmic adaptor subunit [Xanthobacteraceae bacterium]|nr:efflux RND transporter periplasmic adaptor subunit [Xanthobacteraceae bacterium]
MKAYAARLALAAMALALAACDGTPNLTYQGWIEADLIFVGPDEAGRVETLSVREGDPVAAGAPLFTIDAELQQADVSQNTATVTNARQSFARAELLLKSKAGTQKAHDDAQQVLREAEARLNSAQTRLTRRRVFSPAAGVVQQVYYRPGETVIAGRPVVALLPPGNIKVRFFVPEAMLPKIALGDVIKLHCDGCAGDLGARISFIARSAEFTPPVIYSLEERSKLVFLVEARPERPDALRVGQPVSVVLAPAKAP